MIERACEHCGKRISRGLYLSMVDGVRFCDVKCRGEFDTAKIASRVEEEATTGSRRCAHCGETKALGEFYASKQRRDGFSSWCAPCQKAHKRRRKKIDPESFKRSDWKGHIKHKYGLSVEQYEAMRESQHNCCAICETILIPGGRERLCVDHDHATGVVRGLICRPCNSALGLFKDDHIIAQKAADYLREKSPHTRQRAFDVAMAALTARINNSLAQRKRR